MWVHYVHTHPICTINNFSVNSLFCFLITLIIAEIKGYLVGKFATCNIFKVLCKKKVQCVLL